MDWQPTQDHDRLSAPRLRPIWSFNTIVRTEIEAGGADNVTTGENSSYGRLRVCDVTAGHRKWKISVFQTGDDEGEGVTTRLYKSECEVKIARKQ